MKVFNQIGCTKFLLIITCVSCYAAMYSLHLFLNGKQKSEFKLTLNPLKSSIALSYTVEPKSESPQIKIGLWVSPESAPSQSHQEYMKEIVETMNANSTSVCSDFVYDSETETPWTKCHFSIVNDGKNDVDALVFFMFLNGYKLSAMPNSTERNWKQLWVMFSQEPPLVTNWMDPLKQQINWTMTYRVDSDVWAPYGKKVPKSFDEQTTEINIGNQTLNEWISRKSKFIVGVVSHCHTHSKREILIKKMNETQIGPIDIFGGCGNRKVCGRYAKDCSQFWNDLAKEYKFFLAFENSFCKDYITEKFWRTLNLGIVPVVYGAGNYSQFAPPGSFINVNDFKSANELMKYLKHLDQNAEEYAKYFEWRRRYKTGVQVGLWAPHGWCALCKSLLDRRSEGKNGFRNTYSNLKWWYTHQPNNHSICNQPPSRFLK